MLLTCLAIAIFGACLASLWREGLWSNSVRFVNVLLAGLLATNYFEGLGAWLAGLFPDYRHFTQFVAVWFLFGAGVLCLCWITDGLSRHRLRFPALIDHYGSWLLAAAVGWCVVCFAFMTLHTAPLCDRFLFGQFQPQERMVLGLGPDRMWLGLVRYTAWGPLSAGDEAAEGITRPPILHSYQAFADKHAQRRAQLDQLVRQTGSLVIGP